RSGALLPRRRALPPDALDGRAALAPLRGGARAPHRAARPGDRGRGAARGPAGVRGGLPAPRVARASAAAGWRLTPLSRLSQRWPAAGRPSRNAAARRPGRRLGTPAPALPPGIRAP